MEVGLHLEGSPAANQAAFDLLRARLVELKQSLPHAELEPWDKGWYRLYETFPAPLLSAAALNDTAERISAYIKTLQRLMPLQGTPR